MFPKCPRCAGRYHFIRTHASESLRTARTHLHDATDHISEVLVGVPENEIASRIEFVLRDLGRAMAVTVEALRYYAEDLQERASGTEPEER